MKRLIKFIVTAMPLIFAFAFLVPVIDQAMTAAGVPAPFGLPTLVFALVVGGSWGVFAQVTGRWI